MNVKWEPLGCRGTGKEKPDPRRGQAKKSGSRGELAHLNVELVSSSVLFPALSVKILGLGV